MKYQVINTTELAVLEKAVSTLVKKIWKPLGGICVTHVPAVKHGRGAYFTYSQAIVLLGPHETK